MTMTRKDTEISFTVNSFGFPYVPISNSHNNINRNRNVPKDIRFAIANSLAIVKNMPQCLFTSKHSKQVKQAFIALHYV